MGCLSSRPDVVEGALIVDSVVISNSRVRFNDNVISIPVRSLQSGEASVVNIDRKNGEVRITRGPIHGKLEHDTLIEDIELDDKIRKSPMRKSSVYRQSFQL
jgi:hypothetical protein